MSLSLENRLNQSSDLSMRLRYAAVRAVSMRITESLSAEDQMLQSMPEASPVKWHLAHTTWFFETFILTPHLAGYRPFDQKFKELLNSYYKQLGAHPYRGSRGLMSRPSLEDVHAYRAHVDAGILALLGSAPEEVLSLIELGLNHEQQHQELILTDIKHALWLAPLRPDNIDADVSQDAAVPLAWNSIEGGIHVIGHDGKGFAFDNEGPQHEVLLQDYQIGSRAVTNAEYLAFMRDNAYCRPELWLSDGWDTVCSQGWNAPLYWTPLEDGGWGQFVSTGIRRLNPAEPVCHVSFYEADAYARWSGARLPREEEWEIAATRMPSRGTMLEDGVLHPQAARGPGFQQAFGDVWEWTASPYIAYPGFKPAAGLLGEYNGKFMCNQFVLRGGS
ncbi:MAG: ergothioneine biosynthesis protein EgtB, partial [Acidobacteriales bacterium]|nr:ergothioneine biosynthesis protein EgtB [Terriglobales bacterium]